MTVDEAIQRAIARDRIIDLRIGDQPDSPWRLEGSGTLRASYPDGAPMVEGRFVDGKPEGLWTRWHPNGRLLSTVTYEHGVPRASRCGTMPVARLPSARRTSAAT